MSDDKRRKEWKNLLKFVFFTSRGGITRLEIVRILEKKPVNANQLAKELDVDYKTVMHHLESLTKHKLVVKDGDGYGAVYRLSKDFFSNIDVLNELEGKFKS